MNREQNCLLKPKKATKLKITIYLWNSVINEIIDTLIIISHGKPEILK